MSEAFVDRLLSVEPMYFMERVEVPFWLNDSGRYDPPLHFTTIAGKNFSSYLYISDINIFVESSVSISFPVKSVTKGNPYSSCL